MKKSSGVVAKEIKMRFKETAADVVELVYTTDLKSVGRKTMRVQVPPSAPDHRA